VALLSLIACAVGACSSGSSGTGSPGSCAGAASNEGKGWNLGRPALDPDAAARAEVLLASCIPDDRASSRLNGLYSRRTKDELWEMDVVACLAGKSNGCEGVKECTGITVSVGETCEPGCNGNVMVACDSPLKFVADCSKLGARCVTGEGCVPCDSGATCSVVSYTGSCAGGRPVTCSDHHEREGLVCADLGLQCSADPSSLPDELYYGCYGSGASCQTDSSGPGLLVGVGCTGSTLDGCVGGLAFSIDCSQIGSGFSCQHPSGNLYFCGLGSDCDPTASADSTCSGNGVTVCNAGRLDEIDCVALGFTGCDPQWGRCVPGPYASF
jgi:hypothetical protein